MAIRIPSALGAIVALSLLLGAASAIAGGGPGMRVHPIPLHHAAPVGGHWVMKVLSVNPHAEQAFGTAETCGTPAGCTITHGTPPPGAEGYMLAVSLRYVGGGSSTTETVVINAIGSHNAPYEGNACNRSELVEGEQVFSDATVTGDVCFVIAANDAATLRLFVETTSDFLHRTASLFNPNSGNSVWFALR